VYESRGLVHQDLRKHQDAVDDFTSALKIDRTIGENHYHRGESLLRLGDLNGAILDFKSAVELKYSDPLVFNARGMTKRALGHFDEAIDDLTDAVQHAPTNIEFLLNRSICFLDVDDPGSAEQDMNDAINVNPKEYRLYHRRGEARLLLHEFDAAIEDLKDALKYEPTATARVDIQRTLGCAYANSDRHAEGLEYFRMAKDNAALLQANNSLDKSILSPEGRKQELIDEEMDMHEIAKCLQMLGDYEEAIKCFTAVIDLNPRNAHAYFRRAFAYKSMREYEMAAEDFERAKELDPENPNLAINYRNLYDVECIVLCDSGNEPVY
jgi:tetratricopeptide (TPR) repeat protein